MTTSQPEYNHGYHTYHGESLQRLQEVVHPVEPTAYRSDVRQTVISGYTPAGVMRRFFGFFI